MDKEFTNILQTRGVKAKGYGIIPKMVMQDKRLTAESKCIYAYFCSFAGAGDTAFPSIFKICSDLGLGKNRYYRHFKPLQDLGYIDVTQNKNNGKYIQNIYTLVEMPCLRFRETVSSPFPCFGYTENGDTQNGDTQNRDSNNNSIKNNNLKNNNKNNNNTPQKDVVVVQLEIESILRAKISLKQVQSMIDETGIQTIEYYMENWDKFRGTQKTNVVGFFVKAVKEQYPLPRTTNTANFEQREYKDEDFDIYYKKI